MLAIEGQHYYRLLWPASLSATGSPAKVTTGIVCGKVTGKVHTCQLKRSSNVNSVNFPSLKGNLEKWNICNVMFISRTPQKFSSLIPPLRRTNLTISRGRFRMTTMLGT